MRKRKGKMSNTEDEGGRNYKESWGKRMSRS